MASASKVSGSTPMSEVNLKTGQIRLSYTPEELAMRQGKPGAAICAMDLIKIEREIDVATLGLTPEQLQAYYTNPHIRQRFINHEPILHAPEFQETNLYYDNPNNMPRKAYRRRECEVKTTLHSGQTKLFLMEVCFLTDWSQPGDTVFYAGSAPGHHINVLIQMFPGLNWILVDGRKTEVPSAPNVTVIQALVDPTMASNILREGRRVDLFICDIRRGASEADVALDMELQQQVHLVFNPRASVMKFRLPWDNKTTTYLKGRVYMQEYAGRTSTETRLVCSGRDTTVYDNQQYEEIMFFFNTDTRTRLYGQDNSVCRCFDCSAQAYIIRKYRIKYPNGQLDGAPLITVGLSESLRQSLRIGHIQDMSTVLDPDENEPVALIKGQPVAVEPVGPIEPFPFKREFFDPEELWTNAVLENPVVPRVVKLTDERSWPGIPKNFRWQFMGQPVAFVNPKTTYDLVDKLTDYFSEEARLSAHVHECPAPLDFYTSNYSQVITKARELQASDPQKKDSRFYIREAVYHLTSECTTFKIATAKAVLKYFKSKKVLDPSSGWGDRILGAAAAGVTVYHGIDPNSALRSSYDQIIEFIAQRPPQNAMGPITDRFRILTDDFLEVKIQEGGYDTVFTSPPYFNWEVYSNEPGQSISGRSTVEEWTTGFLYPYLQKAWSGLCNGGHMLLYISDVRTGRYVANMSRYVNQQLRGQFLGIIGIVYDDMAYAYPLFCWRK